MNTSKFEFAALAKLLRRSENDPDLRKFFGKAMSNIEHNEFYGTLAFKLDGVDAVFKEAPWVIPLAEVTDPKELFLSGFHLHRKGHQGYSGYPGQLPNGVALDDPKDEIIRKMGQPIAVGGGGTSKLLNGPIPHWIRYSVDDAHLQFRLDANGRVEMATLFTPAPPCSGSAISTGPS